MSNFTAHAIVGSFLAILFVPFAVQNSWHDACREAFPQEGQAHANCVLEPYNK